MSFKMLEKDNKCIICGKYQIEYRSKKMCRKCYSNNLCKKKYKENPEKYKERVLKYCKENCEKVKEKKAKYYKENLEKIKKKNKEYRKINKEKLREYQKEYYKKNSKKIKEKSKKWAERNPDKIKIISARWVRKNSKKIQKAKKRKISNDPHFKLKCRFSTAIYQRLKLRLFSKNGKSTWDFLPYTADELKQHLEKQFEPWMNWNNWGVGKGKWNIDHKIPHSFFNYNSMEDKKFQECWALKNLQPLEAIENIRKSNKQ